MNPVTIVVCVVLALLVGLAVWSILRGRKKGINSCGSCGCGCAGCPMSGKCHTK